jgi:hypothetical protein
MWQVEHLLEGHPLAEKFHSIKYNPRSTSSSSSKEDSRSSDDDEEEEDDLEDHA